VATVPVEVIGSIGNDSSLPALGIEERERGEPKKRQGDPLASDVALNELIENFKALNKNINQNYCSNSPLYREQ